MREHLIAVARGDAEPDLVIAGGQVVSVFTGEIFPADVAIADGYIAGVGQYDSSRRFDAGGQYVLPGFIDGHCHVESSKLDVAEFARAIVSRGTTTIVVDPHELANVVGHAGIDYVLSASENLPVRAFVMAPSCVPASPFESPSAALTADDLEDMLRMPRVIGIAEMMDYPSAIRAEPEALRKMAAAQGRRIDGHAPGIEGKQLNAYLAAGPSSDHECVSYEEALEKRRLGMWIMIREASMIRNLLDLLPLIQRYGPEYSMFVTDDREAGTLLAEGHINSMVCAAVAAGIRIEDAVKLATINVATYHRLDDLGAVAPGYAADLLVCPDLGTFEPSAVFTRGKLVAEGGRTLPFDAAPVPSGMTDTVHVRPVTGPDFRIADSGSSVINVVRLIPDQVVTAAVDMRPSRRVGQIVADPSRDLAKIAVVERHHATGRMGLGMVQGFGLRKGAFGSTIAHDAHNIIVAGVDDDDMALCVDRLASMGGGLVVVSDGQVRGELPLEIAGLMSTMSAQKVAVAIQGLEGELKSMGVNIATPFMYLGFLALSVIPELRLTDRGLVDVRAASIIPLGVP